MFKKPYCLPLAVGWAPWYTETASGNGGNYIYMRKTLARRLAQYNGGRLGRRLILSVLSIDRRRASYSVRAGSRMVVWRRIHFEGWLQILRRAGGLTTSGLVKCNHHIVALYGSRAYKAGFFGSSSRDYAVVIVSNVSYHPPPWPLDACSPQHTELRVVKSFKPANSVEIRVTQRTL